MVDHRAARPTRELISVLAMYRASGDRAHLGQVFAAFARSPRPGLLNDAFEHAAAVLAVLANEAIACEELRAAIEAVDLPILSMPMRPANRREAFVESLDVDEPSVGDEEEARLARLRASTIPPPPDTARSRVLSSDGTSIRESAPDDAEVIDRGGKAWR